MKDKIENSDSIFNKHLIKNISILASLLLLGVILMVIVNHYETQELDEGEPTSAAQLLG